MEVRYRNILVPHDFSTHAQHAVELAADLARRLGARIELVHVIQPHYVAPVTGLAAGAAAPVPPLNLEEVEKNVREGLEAVATALAPTLEGVGCRVVRSVSPAEGICIAAKEVEADLIVMGTHGRTGLAHVFLGSVTERTLRRAPCPVLATRAPAPDEEAEAEAAPADAPA